MPSRKLTSSEKVLATLVLGTDAAVLEIETLCDLSNFLNMTGDYSAPEIMTQLMAYAGTIRECFSISQGRFGDHCKMGGIEKESISALWIKHLREVRGTALGDDFGETGANLPTGADTHDVGEGCATTTSERQTILSLTALMEREFSTVHRKLDAVQQMAGRFRG